MSLKFFLMLIITNIIILGIYGFNNKDSSNGVVNPWLPVLNINYVNLWANILPESVCLLREINGTKEQ